MHFQFIPEQRKLVLSILRKTATIAVFGIISLVDSISSMAAVNDTVHSFINPTKTHENMLPDTAAPQDKLPTQENEWLLSQQDATEQNRSERLLTAGRPAGGSRDFTTFTEIIPGKAPREERCMWSASGALECSEAH
ncbi:hypothetical protein AD947_00260 [Acetobacter tropicalis]|uniref:Uncharacterized protein n=1 Tax=Acetobacter tropicalis TaxID=104102 RepID=A0A149U8I0_9PROT|nr:hypothetical protein AD947_00260 [Acetobacter tropicalis]